MQYLRTRLATNRATPKRRLLTKLLSLISSNPDYEAYLGDVAEWLVEFDEDGLPSREIGLDRNGQPVLAGPDGRNYGFWLDTNMTLGDFDDRETISQNTFEEKWQAWHNEVG
ncbi:MAG: hypothetical protein AAF730_15990 [Bacteroidota bacterium]